MDAFRDREMSGARRVGASGAEFPPRPLRQRAALTAGVAEQLSGSESFEANAAHLVRSRQGQYFLNVAFIDKRADRKHDDIAQTALDRRLKHLGVMAGNTAVVTQRSKGMERSARSPMPS
jgi:hypothetical protein